MVSRLSWGFEMPLRLPPLRLIAFFLALSFLCMGAHELIHHVTTRAVCGSWGTMTYSQFFAPEGCGQKPVWIGTLAGPLLSYALLWIAIAWRSKLSVLLIFANLPLGRAMGVLTSSGDEMLLARRAFGDSAWPALLAITILLLAPPLVAAWRRLEPQGRSWRFAALLVLPLLWDFAFKRLFLGGLLSDGQMQVAGIPVAILASYAAALLLLGLTPPASARDRNSTKARRASISRGEVLQKSL